MDRNLALELVRVTEAAALASARCMGRGDRTGAGAAAVEAMRKAFMVLPIDGEVVIGRSGSEQVPALQAGEKLGRRGEGSHEVEIVAEPIEGMALCASGAPNAISVVAMGEKGKLLRVPDIYMEKIAVGPAARRSIDLRKPASTNLRQVADALGKYIEDLTVVILNRPRNEKLVGEVRGTGARIKLIGDGDVAGALNTCLPDTGVDVLMGIGGAPEGIITAAAIRCVGGAMQARFHFKGEAEKERVREIGIAEPDGVMTAEEMAGGNVMVSVTGITNGDFLKGVRFTSDGALSHSVVMRSKTGTIRYIETVHRFSRPSHGW